MLPPITTRQEWGGTDKGMIKLRLLPVKGPRGSHPFLGGQGDKYHHQNCRMLAPKPHTRNMTDYEIITIKISNIMS